MTVSVEPLLLDTHSFIWWSINSEKLSLTGQDLLFDRNNRLFLNVASVWEMQIKLQLGNLQLNPSFSGSSRLCVIIFAYGIVKCLSGKTFRAILRKKVSV
jgi:hypothetical protein